MQALVKYLKRLAGTKPQAAADANHAIAELIRYRMKNVGEPTMNWERLLRHDLPVSSAVSPNLKDSIVKQVGKKISGDADDNVLSLMNGPTRGQLWGTAARQHGRAFNIEQQLDEFLKPSRFEELQGRYDRAKGYANQVDSIADQAKPPPKDMLEKFLRKYTRGDTSQPLDLIAEAKRKYGK